MNILKLIRVSALAIVPLLSAGAFAQECPQMEGRYKCDGNPPYPLLVRQGFDPEGWEIYNFRSSTEGDKTLIADGVERPIETSIGNGIISGYCDRGRLYVTIRLSGAGREPTVVEDQMYMERGAIVRIRRTSPTKVAAFVCRPDFSRRNRN